MPERLAAVFVNLDSALAGLCERLHWRLEWNAVRLALARESKAVEIQVRHPSSVSCKRRHLSKMLEVANDLKFMLLVQQRSHKF
jgi:hypothetical protein